MSAKVFAADPDPITTSPSASASNETQSELTTLQTAIKEDIARLAQYQGELRTIVEYRIQNKTLQLRNKIKALLDDNTYDKTFMLALIQEQLQFNLKINDYFNDLITKLSQKLGTADDEATLLEISKRELDKDNNYKQRLETLNWLTQIGQDVTAEKTQLTQLLLNRADNFDSFVTYTQQQLQMR